MESAPACNTAETNSDNSAAPAGKTYYLVQVKDINFCWYLKLVIYTKTFVCIFCYWIVGTGDFIPVSIIYSRVPKLLGRQAGRPH
jgi:hypothetical protein